MPADVAGVAGQRPGLGDPGDREQHRDRGARGQVAADEGGPGPAQRQPRRGRVSGQAPGEVADEVLVAAVGRAGAEHEAAARAAGQLPRAAGVIRGDRHQPRGRPADMHHDLAAVPGDVARRAAPPARRAAAPRRCRTPPAPAPRSVSPGRAGRPRGRPAPPAPPASTAPAPSRPETASPAAPAARAPLRRAGTAPTGTCPGSRTPGRQAGHAERLDHVIVQQELPAGRDPPRISEPGQPPQRGGGHRLPPRARRTASLRWRELAHSCPLRRSVAGILYKRIRLKNQHTADTPARGQLPRGTSAGSWPRRGDATTGPQRRPGQGSDRGGPGPDRLHACPAPSPSTAPGAASPAAPARPTRRPCTAPTSSGPAPSTARPSPGCCPRPSTRPTRPGSPAPGGSAR